MKRTIMNAMLLLILLTFSIFTATCDKNSTGSGNSLNDIVGTWIANTLTATVTVTTNTAQEAFNFFEPATGNMSVTGQYATDLRYIMHAANWTMISDYPLVDSGELYKASDYPCHIVSFGQWGSYTFADFTIKIDDNWENDIMYYGNYDDFSETWGSYIVGANNAEFISNDQSDTLVVNGELTAATTTIPANTPTEVLEIPAELDENCQITFNDDGTFTGNVIFDDPSDELSGTWEVDGDQLNLTFDLTDRGLAQVAIELDGHISGGVLYLSKAGDPMDYAYLFNLTGEEFYQHFAWLLGIDEESIETVIYEGELAFTRGVAKSGSFETKPPFSIKSYLENTIKQLLNRTAKLRERCSRDLQ